MLRLRNSYEKLVHKFSDFDFISFDSNDLKRNSNQVGITVSIFSESAEVRFYLVKCVYREMSV